MPGVCDEYLSWTTKHIKRFTNERQTSCELQKRLLLGTFLSVQEIKARCCFGKATFEFNQDADYIKLL